MDMGADTHQRRVDLRALFLGLQNEMRESLVTAKQLSHPGAKGTAAEVDWQNLLLKYLPKRYSVGKAFVLDSEGSVSDEIDLVIFDRQYSPFLFNEGAALHVPAESVYAILEAKPTLTKTALEYAGKKAASVRRLTRTSVPITDAGATRPTKRLFEISAGIVALASSWKPPFSPAFESAVTDVPPDQRLDFGCSLENGAFEVRYPRNRESHITSSKPDSALIEFFLGLVRRLQSLLLPPGEETPS